MRKIFITFIRIFMIFIMGPASARSSSSEQTFDSSVALRIAPRLPHCAGSMQAAVLCRKQASCATLQAVRLPPLSASSTPAVALCRLHAERPKQLTRHLRTLPGVGHTVRVKEKTEACISRRASPARGGSLRLHARKRNWETQEELEQLSMLGFIERQHDTQ